jgi:hypothetical protein
MALHRLTSVTIGVPNVAETSAYYTEFGLTPQHEGWFRTRDGGRQLRIVYSRMRRLVELHVGVDDTDDIIRVADGLRRLGIESARGRHDLMAVEKATGVRATVEVAPRLTQAPVRATIYNGPGRIERTDARAPGVMRTGASPAPEARPRCSRHHRPGRNPCVLPRRSRLQAQRHDEGHRRVHALLKRLGAARTSTNKGAPTMAVAMQTMTDEQRKPIVLEYLKALDNGGTTSTGGSILDLFAEDAQVMFPKWGLAAGKEQIGQLFADIGSSMVGLPQR